MKKIATLVASFLAMVGLIGFVGVASADDSHTFSGTLESLNSANGTFTLETAHSGNIMVTVNGDTQFTDRDGSTRHWSDLMNGEWVKIKGDFSDTANSVDNVDQLILHSD
jgi:hypothetical protein